MIDIKYGPLRQMTDYWAGIRPKQNITFFYGIEGLAEVVSYFDLDAKTETHGEYPATVQMTYEVGETDMAQAHFSVNVKDLANVLADIEPERGGFVRLELGDKDFLPGANFKNPVDSVKIGGYVQIRRYEPDHEVVEYTHGNDVLRVNAATGKLMIGKGTMAMHVEPKTWGDRDEYVAIGNILHRGKFEPETTYDQEELPEMANKRKKRNPLAKAEEPQGTVDEAPVGPLADVESTEEEEDLSVDIDPSIMVADEDGDEEATDTPDEIGTPQTMSISDEVDPDVDAALAGAITVPEETESEEENAVEETVEETTDEETVEEQSEESEEENAVDNDVEETEAPWRIEDEIARAEEAIADPPNRWKCKNNTRQRCIEDLRAHGWLIIDPDHLSALQAALAEVTHTPVEATITFKPEDEPVEVAEATTPDDVPASNLLSSIIGQLSDVTALVEQLENAEPVKAEPSLDDAIRILQEAKQGGK